MNNISQILNVKIDEEVCIDHDYIEKVKFEYMPNSNDEYIREYPYTWIAYTNAEHYHRTIFPMKNKSMGEFF